MAKEKKKSSAKMTEEEVIRALEDLSYYEMSSDEATAATQNILRLRQAEEIAKGKKNRLDKTKVFETVAGTLLPAALCIYAEEIGGKIVTSKVWSKLKLK